MYIITRVYLGRTWVEKENKPSDSLRQSLSKSFFFFLYFMSFLAIFPLESLSFQRAVLYLDSLDIQSRLNTKKEFYFLPVKEVLSVEWLSQDKQLDDKPFRLIRFGESCLCILIRAMAYIVIYWRGWLIGIYCVFFVMRNTK